MNSKISLIALLFTLIFNNACQDSASSSLNAVDKNRDVILIGMGGYLSCPDSNLYGATHFSKMQDIENALRAQGRDTKKIFSCYDSSAADIQNLAIHFAMPDGQQRTDNIWWYMDLIANEINSNPDHDVYLIGHSHGGWLSLKLLNDKIFDRPIKGYFSIDPISRVECSPTKFAENTVGNIFGRTNPAENPCLKFPYDAGDLAKIRRNTGFWKNFYQENSPFLHSGSAPNAENIRKDYGPENGFDPINSAHSKIWGDWAVWGDFKYLIENGY